MTEMARFPTSGIPFQAPRPFGVAPSFPEYYAPVSESDLVKTYTRDETRAAELSDRMKN